MRAKVSTYFNVNKIKYLQLFETASQKHIAV